MEVKLRIFKGSFAEALFFGQDEGWGFGYGYGYSSGSGEGSGDGSGYGGGYGYGDGYAATESNGMEEIKEKTKAF